MRIANRKLGVLAGVLALALGACGGDDDGTSGDGDGDGNNPDGSSSAIVTVSDDITADAAWTADHTYVLADHIFVRGATLTIEAGTTIQGENNSSLVITTSGKLVASGTATAPIVFTSAQPEGSRAAGDWGGVVLLGLAPINVEGGTEVIEGFDAGTDGIQYGGDDPTHDCGSLDYVRIEFAGFELSVDNELNALTLGGCGSDTHIDHIQAHMGADDGVEMFGGQATITHLLVSQPDDDGLDWDFGWSGKAQFVIVQQNGVVGNHGFEADNNVNDNDADPRSNPTIWNATLIGSDTDPGTAGKVQGGMMLRRGTAGSIHNVIVAYFTDFAVDVADYSTVQQAEADDLAVSYSYLYQNANDADNGFPSGFDVVDGTEDDCETPAPDCTGFDEEGHFTDTASYHNVFGDPMLSDPLNLTAPDFAPADGSPILAGGDTPPSGFDASATYIGAIGTSDWTDGWTAFPAN
jgi:hypothetical protein